MPQPHCLWNMFSCSQFKHLSYCIKRKRYSLGEKLTNLYHSPNQDSKWSKKIQERSTFYYSWSIVFLVNTLSRYIYLESVYVGVFLNSLSCLLNFGYFYQDNSIHCCPQWKQSITPPNLHKTTKEKVGLILYPLSRRKNAIVLQSLAKERRYKCDILQELRRNTLKEEEHGSEIR